MAGTMMMKTTKIIIKAIMPIYQLQSKESVVH